MLVFAHTGQSFLGSEEGFAIPLSPTQRKAFASSDGSEALGPWTWLYLCQGHTFTQDFIYSLHIHWGLPPPSKVVTIATNDMLLYR